MLGTILSKSDISQSKKAEEYIQEGTRIMDELELKPLASYGYCHLGELYADMGQHEKALEALKRAKGAFQEMGMGYWLRRTQTVLERL